MCQLVSTSSCDSAAASTTGLNAEPGCRPGSAEAGGQRVHLGGGARVLGALAERLGSDRHHTDVAAARVDAHERPERVGGGVGEGLTQHRLGGVLPPHVESGPDREPAAEDGVGARLAGVAELLGGEELLLHVLEEELVGRVRGLGDPHDVVEWDAGGLGLLGRDRTGADHARQDHVPPTCRGLGVGDRVHRLGALDEAGEERRPREVELADGSAEVVLARCGDAVGAVAEVGDVQVAREDLVLVEMLLEPDRPGGLGDLALEALLVGQQRVLDVLLGDRGGALLDVAGGEVAERRPDDRGRLDALVLVEPGVLGRDHRVLELVRDLRQRDDIAVLGTGEDRDLLTGGVEHHRALRWPIDVRQVLDVEDVLAGPRQHLVGPTQERDRGGDEDEDEDGPQERRPDRVAPDAGHRRALGRPGPDAAGRRGPLGPASQPCGGTRALPPRPRGQRGGGRPEAREGPLQAGGWGHGDPTMTDASPTGPPRSRPFGRVRRGLVTSSQRGRGSSALCGGTSPRSTPLDESTPRPTRRRPR